MKPGSRKSLACPPSKVVDLLGLMGDSIDNIPGAPGIGAKGRGANHYAVWLD